MLVEVHELIPCLQAQVFSIKVYGFFVDSTRLTTAAVFRNAPLQLFLSLPDALDTDVQYLIFNFIRGNALS